MSARRIAAIDIGTVTTRLLVADVHDGGEIVEIARSTDITHLGEDLTATGRLAPAAMGRVERAIASYAETIRDLGAERVEAVATSASRDAANAEEFIALLAPHGITPRVVAGEREAYLSFLGATYGIESGPVLVDDIGGGSTELVFGMPGVRPDLAPDVQMARSIDVGSRRLTELFLESDPPGSREIDRAREFAVDAMRPFFDGLRERPRALYSLAGTATSLSAITQGLAVYDAQAVHGSVLTGHDVSDALEMLAALPLERRREVVGLHPDRAGVIVAGALILESVLALAGLDSTVVSEHDILYGILLDASWGDRG